MKIMKKTIKQNNKVGKITSNFKEETLNSIIDGGSLKPLKRQQAVAIALRKATLALRKDKISTE